jgi:hypothetical protein
MIVKGIQLKRLSISSFAIAVALAIVPVARADSFTFSYTAPGGVSGSGTLAGTPEGIINGNQAWLLNSGSGTFNDGTNSGSITLVPNPNGPGGTSLSLSTYFTYDDLLYPPAGPGNYLDSLGLLFNFGSAELNLYDFLGDGWYENNGDSGYGTLTITLIPEPGTWLLLGSGLLLLAIARLGRATWSKPALNE